MNEIINMMNTLVDAVNTYDYECIVNRLESQDVNELGIEMLGKVYFNCNYNAQTEPDYVLVPDDKSKNGIMIAPADIRQVKASVNGTLGVLVEKWEKDEHGNTYMRRTVFDFRRILVLNKICAGN